MLKRFLLYVVVFLNCAMFWFSVGTQVEVLRRIQGINGMEFVQVDLAIRTLHYSAGHKSKVLGCRECYKEIYDYLNELQNQYPDMIK